MEALFQSFEKAYRYYVSLDDLPFQENQERMGRIKDNVVRDSWNPLSKGLIIAGAQGRGKSTILRALYQSLRMWDRLKAYSSSAPGSDGLTIRPGFISLKDLNREIKAEGYEAIDRFMREHDYLFIDDIGLLKPASFYGKEIDAIPYIVTTMANSPRSWKLFTTTNQTKEGLKKRYGMRVFDRLNVYTRFIQLSGINYRNVQ